ncbi:MAG: hypothetical protein OEW04_12970 [Nitrospirota bacterium]|nr:hypothetical protein [Nitrospirota bacterium]
MKDFKQALYESLLVSFGKVLSNYNAFAQGTVLHDVGKEIIDYLNKNGYEFDETDTLDDVGRLIDLFVKNGFADKLEVFPADKGHKYIWHNVYGLDAYRELQKYSDNPFLSCPLNASVFYLAGKHNKTLVLHKEFFDTAKKIVESQEELVDKTVDDRKGLDPLVIENARLLKLAEERERELKKSQEEIKRLRGIIPICSSCKKIRNDKGYWQQVEDYISTHTEASFSHGYCPVCYEKAMEEIKKHQTA